MFEISGACEPYLRSSEQSCAGEGGGGGWVDKALIILKKVKR